MIHRKAAEHTGGVDCNRRLVEIGHRVELRLWKLLSMAL